MHTANLRKGETNVIFYLFFLFSGTTVHCSLHLFNELLPVSYVFFTSLCNFVFISICLHTIPLFVVWSSPQSNSDGYCYILD